MKEKPSSNLSENRYDLEYLENALHHLNYRWNLEALALWKGDKAPFEPYLIYDGYDDFISLETLAVIDRTEEATARNCLRHALIDHYLQRALLPHETEMRAWMRGASGNVEGHKIYFRDIIPWCQKSSTYEQRQVLQKEIKPLCKFLKPFALNYWNMLLDILREELGFQNYIDYCSQKKGIDYAYYYRTLKRLLEDTDELYFKAMEEWSRRQFGLPLEELTRFDAINLLGLGEFDSFFPAREIKDLTRFFEYWGIDLDKTEGLNLELGDEQEKSAQAICFFLQVPEEIYVLMKPQGGWTDLEALWHELGHGLSAVFTSPKLSIIHRDLATSQCLSEAFAFLVQNVTFSTPFLEEYLGLDNYKSKELSYFKVLRDLSVFRRYAAKFMAEYDMFSYGDISDGKPYAWCLKRYTGFYYQPESHLFDLVPEFYSLDYILGWQAEAVMEGYLKETQGPRWMFRPEAGEILRRWWKQGNRYDIFNFFERNKLGPLGPERLLTRWKEMPALKGGT